MSLSVVITTYNRSEVLKQNLDCFMKQTDMDFEVVVAIDGGTDDTPEMLTGYEAPFPIKSIDTLERDTYCLAKARNMGIVETTRPIVVILDDDSFPAPGFVAAHKASVTQGVLTGGYRNSHDPKDSLHAKMKKTLLKYGIRKPHPITERIVENNACMYRHDWVGCGMFSERFRGYGGCGQEFVARLAYLGYKYQFNPEAMMYHHREFEGDNGLTREMKDQQAMEQAVMIDKHCRRF
jgi:glycosyltransferase involved in cell wall biosynthesis